MVATVSIQRPLFYLLILVTITLPLTLRSVVTVTSCVQSVESSATFVCLVFLKNKRELNWTWKPEPVCRGLTEPGQ